MSWDTKTDYCGLAVEGKLQIKSATMNRSGQYLEKLGKNAAIAATKAFGVNDSPNCEYTILSAHKLTGVKLGKIATVEGKKYALQSLKYETGAGTEPKVTATAREVEASANDSNCNKFAVPDIEISPEEVADIIAAAFTLSGESCELTKCSAEASCTVSPHTVNGAVVASDVRSGHIQVSVSIGQYGEAAPVLTPADGWDISSPLTCTDPDSDLPEWTATLSKPLTKEVKAS